MTEERYKRRVEELLKSNKELQEEIKVLEGERINWLSEKQTVGKTSGSGMRAPKVKNNMTGSLDSSSFGSTTPRQLSQSTKLPSRPRLSASSPPQTENVPTQKSRPIVKSKPKLSSSPSSSSLSSSSSSHLPSGLASSVSMSSSVSRPGRRVHGNLSTSMYKQHDDLDGERMLGISDTLSEVSTVYSNTTNDFVNRDWEQFFNNVERASGLNGILENNIYPDGKRERIYADGTRVVLYKNGTTKEYRHGGATIVRFMNGDMKETTSTHTLYYYSSTRTTHTTYPSGLEIFEFSNGQVEKRHPNGTNEIYFPDKTVKIVYKNGMEKSIFPDGTVQVVDEKGWRTVVWKDGSKEIYTPTYKTRIQPDGTTKIVYEDGTQETRYPDGRVRVKNKLGLIVQDGYDSTDSKSFDIPSNLLLSHSQLDQYSVNNDDDAHKDNELEIKNLNVKLPGSSYKHNIEIEDDESPSSEDQQSQEESYDVSLQAEEAVDIDYDISENIGSKVGGLVM
ncbi:T-complex protein 10 C-terminus-domain-containing protein [Paraphysoderma sedebokerense]|nr:T-complex protein 10 C-terminus-domain-containing protein [Paraphysoderma sedebokerense]